MPAPTALQRPLSDEQPITTTPTSFPTSTIPSEIEAEAETAMILDPSETLSIAPPATTTTSSSLPLSETMQTDEESRPQFEPLATNLQTTTTTRSESRKIPIPPHRMSALKQSWPKIYPPLVEHLHLQVRMNVKAKAVELRTSSKGVAAEPGALQKGEDFVKAFTLGFDVEDAVALLRLDELFVETFEIKDVKTLSGDHLSRAIGRIAGKDGKTKFAIENASKTRVVLAGSKIHILGGFKNIHIARESIVSLILGKQPGKVYNGLRTVSARMKERF